MGKSRNERLLRPPGALDETDFLSRCIRCGECMKVCPNNSLHPTLTRLDLKDCGRRRWCRASATASRVACFALKCARRARSGRSRRRKRVGWWAWASAQNQPVRLGTAFYDRGRCLPWAMATDCIVCEEWCPVSPKAIYVEEAQVIDSAGNIKTVKQPRVDPSRCVGCGACEYACPLQERPAVYVTSIGESRSPSSQILLNRK